MILFNLAARSIRAGQLTLLAQTETILGPVWVYLLFREEPRLTTVAGGALILLGVMLSAWASGRAPVAGNVPDHRQEDNHRRHVEEDRARGEEELLHRGSLRSRP